MLVLEEDDSPEQIGLVVSEALRHIPPVAEFSAPMEVLQTCRLQLTGVADLRVRDECSPGQLLELVREASSLKVLHVDGVRSESSIAQPEAPASPCSLPLLEHLEIENCFYVPKLLLEHLHLPNIQSLKLQGVYCGIKEGDRQLGSLVPNVSWLARVRSLFLREAKISQDTLIWTLRKMPSFNAPDTGFLAEGQLQNNKSTIGTGHGTARMAVPSPGGGRFQGLSPGRRE